MQGSEKFEKVKAASIHKANSRSMRIDFDYKPFPEPSKHVTQPSKSNIFSKTEASDLRHNSNASNQGTDHEYDDLKSQFDEFKHLVTSKLATLQNPSGLKVNSHSSPHEGSSSRNVSKNKLQTAASNNRQDGSQFFRKDQDPVLLEGK